MNNILQQELTLPCGAVLSNRIAKAALTEGLADANGMPTAELKRLYALWSDGGAGLLLSGNIQIDANHLERPGNVIIESKPQNNLINALKDWCTTATRNNNHFWAQISHAGRQTQTNINKTPKAPSPIKVALPGEQFGHPIALTTGEIKKIIDGFGIAAITCKNSGFTGIQIHAAHGYLLSQFLSPRSNIRTDAYGGELSNRAQLLIEIVRTVRSRVGNDFPISVKLNSADFQKGGFNFQDSLQVAGWLEEEKIDLLEISGGTYEQPRLLGVEGIGEYEDQNIAKSTVKREAYFVDFAIELRKKISTPMMVTGGFRHRNAMVHAIESGAADLIGIGRPLCVLTDAPKKLFEGLNELPRYEKELKFFPWWLSFLRKIQPFKTMGTFGIQFWFYAQLDLLGKEGKPNTSISPFYATRKILALQKKWLSVRDKFLKFE